MTRLMPRKSALVFAAFVISLASGSVLAQDVQLIEFKPKKTLTLRDLPRVKQIAHGGCCAHVGGGCISWCNKTEGCTGSGDCDVTPD
jgi:hypothetical protein